MELNILYLDGFLFYLGSKVRHMQLKTHSTACPIFKDKCGISVAGTAVSRGKRASTSVIIPTSVGLEERKKIIQGDYFRLGEGLNFTNKSFDRKCRSLWKHRVEKHLTSAPAPLVTVTS